MREKLSPIRPSRPLLPAIVAVAALGVGKLMLDIAQPGPFAAHMGLHIVLMNVVAPFLTLAALARFPDLPGRFASGRALVAASLAQLAALWAWHAPPALELALAAPSIHAAMQVSLFAAACLFWLAVLADRSAMRWRALAALLFTGKLFCLLGVLLVFAPRLIYPGLQPAHGHAAIPAGVALSDQQLAGLLMLVACPLSYLLAGVTIAARWLRADADRAATARGLAGSA